MEDICIMNINQFIIFQQNAIREGRFFTVDDTTYYVGDVFLSNYNNIPHYFALAYTEAAVNNGELTTYRIRWDYCNDWVEAIKEWDRHGSDIRFMPLLLWDEANACEWNKPAAIEQQLFQDVTVVFNLTYMY